MGNINLTVKPHHLLDIFKLHGKGIDRFVPDAKFHHDFYAIANAIMENRVNTIQFTCGYDDICKPCIRLRNKICTDTFSCNGMVHDKNSYNETLDKKLLHILNLNADTIYDFKDILHLLHARLNFDLIHKVWNEHSQEENTSRYDYTKKGLDKYIKAWNIL